MTEPTELVEQIARKAAAHFDLTCRDGQPIETLADLSSAEMDVGSVDCLLFARAIIPIIEAHYAARIAELEDVLVPVGWQRRRLYPLKSDSAGKTYQWEMCSAREATDYFEKTPGYEYRAIYALRSNTDKTQGEAQ